MSTPTENEMLAAFGALGFDTSPDAPEQPTAEEWRTAADRVIDLHGDTEDSRRLRALLLKNERNAA
jgi:hypothetical protein